MVVRPSRKTKSPPVMSHEFVIQNHADIVSCVAMVFIIGLMVQITTPLATIFLIPQHMVDGTGDSITNQALYTHGLKDAAVIFFYTLIVIVVHAVAQEYLLDKVTKKLHLSKTKHSKFNWSGQIALFALISAFWGLHNIFKDENFTSPYSLWSDYPEMHSQMTFKSKFFFITQIAYWLHCYPELYFQRVKREEMPDQVSYATVHLILIAGAYCINLVQLATVLLVLHFLCEALLHSAKLLHYAELEKHSKSAFSLHNTLFVAVRLVSLILSILTIQFGLGSAGNQELNLATGNFNILPIRLLALALACGSQVWMLYSFATFQLGKRRKSHVQAPKPAPVKEVVKKAKKVRSSDEEVSALPEVDQNTRKRGLKAR